MILADKRPISTSTYHKEIMGIIILIRQNSIVTRVFRTEAAAASAATRGTNPAPAR